VRSLNFRKTAPRTYFTTIFGRVGKRRVLRNRQLTLLQKQRTKMQMIRRAHQGWRNKQIGSIQSLKIRLQYGRRKSIPQFRR